VIAHNPFEETFSDKENATEYLREDRKHAIIEKLQREREARRKYVAEGRGQDFKLQTFSSNADENTASGGQYQSSDMLYHLRDNTIQNARTIEDSLGSMNQMAIVEEIRRNV
jgi:hypothetical protein